MLSRMRSLFRRKPRRGAIAVLVAFCLTVLLTCVAIAVDGGLLLEEARHAQATADTAALAAAEDLFRNYPANHGVDPNNSARDRALAIAAGNGYTNNGTNSVVTVRISPQKYASGPDKEKEDKRLPAGYAEVTVQYNQPRYFSGVISTGTIPVTARAVARGRWVPSAIGIHVLDMNAPSSLTGVGGGTLTLTGGASIIVNSSDPEAAVSITGSMSASQFDITGGSVGSGFTGTINYGVDPQPDPLRYLAEPDPSTLTQQSNHKLTLASGAPRTISPGVYKGGISITGQGNITMEPGVYYMDGGGFYFGGSGNLNATGVMIFNAPSGPSDVISITGSNNGSITMTPPTSGPYTGISFFQERSASHPVNITGNGTFSIKGTFYAAGAQVLVGGNGDAKIGSQYISRYLAIAGSGNFDCFYDPNQVAPERVLGLVE